MESIEFLLELAGGSVLLLGFGWLIGHLLKSDQFSKDLEKKKEFKLRKTEGVMNETDD